MSFKVLYVIILQKYILQFCQSTPIEGMIHYAGVVGDV